MTTTSRRRERAPEEERYSGGRVIMSNCSLKTVFVHGPCTSQIWLGESKEQSKNARLFGLTIWSLFIDKAVGPHRRPSLYLASFLKTQNLRSGGGAAAEL